MVRIVLDEARADCTYGYTLETSEASQWQLTFLMEAWLKTPGCGIPRFPQPLKAERGHSSMENRARALEIARST